jgi:hypothetical protein
MSFDPLPYFKAAPCAACAHRSRVSADCIDPPPSPSRGRRPSFPAGPPSRPPPPHVWTPTPFFFLLALPQPERAAMSHCAPLFRSTPSCPRPSVSTPPSSLHDTICPPPPAGVHHASLDFIKPSSPTALHGEICLCSTFP